MKEELIALGKVLQSDFENLINQQVAGWLTYDSLTDGDWQQLEKLEVELYGFFEINEQFATLEAWLTSGFMPGELPDLDLAEEWTAARGKSLSISSPKSSYPNHEIWNQQTKSELSSSVKPTKSYSTNEVKNITQFSERASPPELKRLDGVLETSKSTTNEQEVKNITNAQAWSSRLEPQDLAYVLDASKPITDKQGVKNTTQDSGWLESLKPQDLAYVPEALKSTTNEQEVKNITDVQGWHSRLEPQDLAYVLDASEPITDKQGVKNTTQDSGWLESLKPQDLAYVPEALKSTTNEQEVKNITDVQGWHSRLEPQDFVYVPKAPKSVTDKQEAKNITQNEGWTSPLESQELELSTSITEIEEVKSKIQSEWRAPLRLKDLANFLASESYPPESDIVIKQQPQLIQPEIPTVSTIISPNQDSGYWEGLQAKTEIDWSDLIPKARPQNAHPSLESDGVASYPANTHTPHISECFESNQTELFNLEQHQDRELQMEIESSPTRNQEIDMDLIVEAIAQEINREYRRFYGC